ncbi:type II secretion system protein [Microbacterium aurum]
MERSGYIEMGQNIKIEQRGFTIIEVVLVLAIAGLIFLMVFVALPALQRSQRDTARKNDVSTVAAAVNSFTSSNRGNMPTTSQIQNYVDEVSDNTVRVLVAPATSGSGAPAALRAIDGIATSTQTNRGVQDGLIVVVPGAKCGTSTTSQSFQRGAARQYAVVTKIEAGGGTAFCQDN